MQQMMCDLAMEDIDYIKLYTLKMNNIHIICSLYAYNKEISYLVLTNYS